jgi:hypothetical protein
MTAGGLDGTGPRPRSSKSDFVLSGAGRTLEHVLPPIENGDPGDESTED